MSQIITVQLGPYSNFIGSHFWNIQESNFVYLTPSEALQGIGSDVNHDVLFREGRTLQREATFTPRLVCVDLRGGLGSLSQRGTLYSAPSSQSNYDWSGGVEVHKQERLPKNQFLAGLEDDESEALGRSSVSGSEKDVCYSDSTSGVKNSKPLECNLDHVVTVWTDYLRPHFHPRSVLTTKEHDFENESNPFDIHGCGVAEWKNTDLGDEVMDSLRFYAEECDSLEGFNIIFDSFNGFSGMALKAQEYLQEEYSTKVTHAFPVQPAKFAVETYKTVNARLINLALSFTSAYDNSTMFTPMTLSESYKKSRGKFMTHVRYNENLDYHTSAILAGALDTITLPFRRKSERKRMREMAEIFGYSGRKFSVLGMQFPLQMLENETLVEYYGRSKEQPWTMLAPSSEQGSVTAQNVVLRGVSESRLKRAGAVTPSRRAGLIGSSSIQEATEMFLYGLHPRTVNLMDVCKDPLKTSVPFPQFFTKQITKDGFTKTTNQREGGVSSLPVMTSLQSGDACKSALDALLRDVKDVKIKRFSRFSELGLEEEEWTDTVEKLHECRYSFDETYD